MAVDQVRAPVKEQVIHHEVFLATRKFQRYHTEDPSMCDREVIRFAARLLQAVIDHRATPGPHVLDEMGERAKSYQPPGQVEQVLKDVVAELLTGWRPDGMDALLGTREHLSRAERPGESFSRLLGAPNDWYAD